ncbi:uncharacterized protein LOC133174885 [Saccostrea echinata]|uniref:uncharacterized protein LOC133174885 n=1 Tax=Saccostrea echinata TaxID=191078 RepID=UPI002A7EB9B2|nr:uncharacterized protein LOC133174885 [Saccostrea echinata]
MGILTSRSAMKPYVPRGLDFFLIWILFQKADSFLKSGRKGFYLEHTLNNWTQASESCNLVVSNRSLFIGLPITDIPILKSTTSDQSIELQQSGLHWIGATGTFTPWFELLGCFLYKFVEKNASITDSTSITSPFTKCYEICKEYSFFGINDAICFCAENATFGKVLNSTCVLSNSFNFKTDIIGTSKTVYNYIYRGFAVYRKVERIANLEDTLGECLIETDDRIETYPYHIIYCHCTLISNFLQNSSIII